MNDTSGDRVMVALTSAPSQAVAEQMARRLVDERLAACANVVVGVTSIFRWEGEVQREGS
jgi:periplasmic divalent cation tolerance protein